MATVYLARDTKLNRPVAVKVLRPELSDLLGRERFLREIEIAAGLQHANILPLHDSGSAAGLLYYVMPYIEGESLRDQLNRERQLPLEEALQIAREVAEALSYAHSRGFVHRDIKPENILLSNSHALVADFGIARAISVAGGTQLTERGIAVGTPAYMSPEQCSGQDPVDGRSDLYALACVLYEMLAGEPPFGGRTAQAIIARHLQERPPSLRIVRPTVTLSVQRAIETALAKVPADRYPTAMQFVSALESARTGRTERLRRWLRVAGITLALTGAGALWRYVLAPARSLDANKVMVFPLAERGGEGAGERVALMIGSALEHTEPLKWIDGWARLDPEARVDISRLTAGAERRLARGQGARYYIEGSVVWQRDSATVILRLNDTAGDSTVARVSASGTGNESILPQLALQGMNQLLPPLLAPNRHVDLTALAERQPAAVAIWLEGEREYRRSHFKTALAYYRRAVEDDSTLVVAALKGGWAAHWENADAEALRFVDVALARRTLLPPRYVDFAMGLRDYLTGDADSAAARFRRAIAVDSEWVEAWMGLGEVYYHLIPVGWVLDSVSDDAFSKALRIDREFAPALFHLSEIALRRGDLGRAEHLVESFRATSPDSLWLKQLLIMLDCARGGPRHVDWRSESAVHAAEVVAAAKVLVNATDYMACASDGFRSVLTARTAPENERWGALIGLQSLLVEQGRARAVWPLLDSAVASGMRAAMGLVVVDALAGAGGDDSAAAAIATLGDRYETMSPPALWWRGVWEAHLKHVDQVAVIARLLIRRATQTGDRTDRLMADGMAAHLALARGDTAEALSRLQNLRPAGNGVDIAWGLWEPLAGEQMALAELLLARGDAERALRVAEQLDHPQPMLYLVYRSASLGLRVRAATALGQPDLVRKYRQRLTALH